MFVTVQVSCHISDVSDLSADRKNGISNNDRSKSAAVIAAATVSPTNSLMGREVRMGKKIWRQMRKECRWEEER